MQRITFEGCECIVAAPEDIEAIERELAAVRNENAELRTLLAVRIAGPSLYHDDGELQDTSAAPFIDWRRDSVEMIQAKLWQRNAPHGGEVQGG